MSQKKQILILAVLGLFLSASLAYFSFIPPSLPSHPKEIDKRIKTLPSPLPTTNKAEVKLSFNPAELTLPAGEILEIQILAESEEKIIATDLELAFDPKSLRVKEAKPGSFWQNPQQLSYVFDNEKGEIFYSLASLKPTSGKGIIASFTFETRPISPKSQVTTIFLGPKTEVSVFGKESQLTITNGKYVILKGKG